MQSLAAALPGMGISSGLGPALGRIASSVASTANYGMARVLSITASLNQRASSLLLDAVLAYELPTSLSARAQDDGVEEEVDAPAPITTTIAALDVEAVAAAAPATDGDGHVQGVPPPAAAHDAAESKPVAKVAQTVCLFCASASLLLFVNPPRQQQGRRRLLAVYRVNLAFVCLALFTSLGLSMFSIMARSGAGPAVAKVQKWGMVVALASVLVASTLRLVMALPAASLESASLAVLLLAAAVAVYLLQAWKIGGGRRAIRPSLSGSSDGAGVADRV